MSRHRLELLVFLAVVAFTELSITRGLEGANEWSRMSLVFSIVERGKLDIDGWSGMTPDWSRANGHFYSSKAPGPALLAVPGYFVQHQIQRLLHIPDDRPAARQIAGYFANAIAGVLPTLLALALLWGLLVRHFRLEPLQAFALAGVWAGCSLALPYATTFLGHQTAAAFLCIGIALSIGELDRFRRKRKLRLALAGAALAFTVACDYGTLPAVAIWSLWIAWQLERPRLIFACVLGGLAPVAMLMAYHAACFGSVTHTAYSPQFLSPEFVPVMHFDLPRLSRLLGVTVLPRRGLFYCTPVYALTLAAVWRLRDHQSERRELTVAAATVLASLLLLISTPDWVGGWCVGPRFLTAQLPAATLLLIPALRRWPRLFALAAVASGLCMLAATLVEPLQWDLLANPFLQNIWPRLRSGGPSPVHSLLSLAFGLPRWSAFGCYLALWCALGLWLRSRCASPSSAPAPAASLLDRLRGFVASTASSMRRA